jgi:hypothetical protein
VSGERERERGVTDAERREAGQAVKYYVSFFLSFHSLSVYLCSLKIHGVHKRALKVLDPRVLTLEQPLKLQVRVSPKRRWRTNGWIVQIERER